MSESKSGKIIPFAQNASFYMKRGAKELGRNDMLAALHRYRLAYQAAPDETEPVLALAQILSHMQRFEESNRLILSLIARGNAAPECHFGLACNYFGMREYDYAVESLENYLDLDPDGPYAPDAEDFLDMLDDDQAMYEIAGLKDDADYDANAACVYARHLMNAGDYHAAISVLRHESMHEPDSVQIQNQLAIAYFCSEDHEKAAGVIRELMESGKADILTRSHYALLCLAEGDRKAADEVIDALMNTRTESPEALQSIAVLLIETARYREAVGVLEQLMHLKPYDESVLHMLGLCRYHLGEYAAAQNCYRKLLRIDNTDTVAKYYLKQSRKTDVDERYIRAHWSVQYQVPFPEFFRRLSQLNRYLHLPEAEQRRLWENDVRFLDLVKWALSASDLRVKKTVLGVLYAYRDARAEELLRDFLLRTEQPDGLKRAVFGMLKQMGAREPYMAYLDGRWLQGRVNLLPFPYELPAAYESVMRLLLQAMPGLYDDNCLKAATAVYKRYIESLRQSFPRISTQQVVSMAAALELLGCRQCGIKTDEEEFCARYRITATRLRNALLKLEPFYEDGGEMP